MATDTRIRVPCQMPPACECEPNWTTWDSIERRTFNVRHGANPEAVAEFADRVLRLSDTCHSGHVGVVEEWMSRTYEHLHGPHDH